MATWMNQMFGLEPFEEMSGSSWTGVNERPGPRPVPDSMSESAPASRVRRNSLFSRKSTKDKEDAKSTPSVHSFDPSPPLVSLHPNISTDSISSLAPNRSIIPDALKELPAWYNDVDAQASPVHIRARFPIHNPIGPRYYRNVHLRTPNSSKRPPSVFSPAFPPMAADHSEEVPHVPGPSRTPSGSPLPTPNSSQSRLNDGPPKVRTRKTSTTPHDNVDLLDVSDPWGTNWHHQSPYDGFGLNADKPPVQTPPEPHATPRSRVPSAGTAPRHKTTAPSPLSQSTSAVHLDVPDTDASKLGRKLTKRRKTLRGAFHRSKDDSDVPPHASSAPVTPHDPTATLMFSTARNRTSAPPARLGIPKSVSTTSIPNTASIMSDNKNKRGSILGRMVRRFSVLRRGPSGHARNGSESSTGWPEGVNPTRLSVAPPKHASLDPNRASIEGGKRVPVPSVVLEPPPPLNSVTETTTDANDDRKSSISLEAPFSAGRLTIANPDSPSSNDDSPVLHPASLPHSRGPSGQSQPHIRVDKDLPIPTPSPAPVLDRGVLVESPTQLHPPHSFTFPSMSPTAPTQTSPVQVVPSGDHVPPTRPSAPAAQISSPAMVQVVASSSSADDSPLSKASILVNPPTPHIPQVPISVSATHAPSPLAASQPVAVSPPPSTHIQIPSPMVSPMPSNSPPSPTNMPHGPREASPTKRQQSARHVKSSSPVLSRETETFRLVRSPSSNAQVNSETIVAQGEHWEVIGAPGSSKRSKTSKDESRRSKSSKRHEDRQESGSKSPTRTLSATSPTGQGEPTKSRRESSSKKRGSHDEHREHAASRATSTSPHEGYAHHERRPSISTTRPTSELTSAADLNAVRAREVWEMDRLWKGRSMATAYGLEGPQVVYAQSIGNTSSTTVNGGDLRRATSGVYGSNHTSYKLQHGFHGQSPIPFPGSPVIYPQTDTAPHPSYVYPGGFKSYPDISTLPTITSPDSSPPRGPHANPLPEPPRQSAYKPGPLPASFAEHDPGTAEYWQKYAGVVAAATH
ncbi:hypothetical protein OF83DRAFT_1080462 [Amylostereum chailletii]|nr:hypothetical protein OF83DRAFT_1080462 [Amylostereum chailletii]